MYNANGLVPAAEYLFPYADDTFDLAVLTSVFTHMRAAEVRHYLDEVARVLRSGGRCLITFFLLSDESRPAIGAGASDLSFRYGEGIMRFDHPTKPEAAVAYEEDAFAPGSAKSGWRPRSRSGMARGAAGRARLAIRTSWSLRSRSANCDRGVAPRAERRSRAPASVT